MKEHSTEEIKNRMLKNAATLWGFPANEIDMSFDPVVSMLLTACAAELEKIANELEDSQKRITENIIQLMTPEFIFGARPSHAILYTESLEQKITINPEYLFIYKKKISYKNTAVNYKDINFSPLQKFNITSSSIKYIATGNTISEALKNKQFDVIYKEDNPKNSLDPATLYLGIASNTKNLDLNEVSFYFEQQDLKVNKLFYHHLKNAEWYINDQKIKTTEGFYNTQSVNGLKLNSIFDKTSSKTYNIEEQVRNIYAKNYITIKEKLKKNTLNAPPFLELQEVITNNKLKIEDNILWIKIKFPRVISNTILKTVFCSLNAVPVINRKLNTFTYQLKEYINIIPITTEDYFLDLKSLTNTSGKNYHLQSKSDSITTKGTFNVKSENIGKLDYRKAREHIKHLIELLKDESASFSHYNNDFLYKNLNALNQLIAILEKKVEEIATEVTETNYINLTPYRKKETLIVEYWTTNGVEGTNIKTGSNLKIYNGIGIKQKSSYLLTTSFGGRNNLSMNERLNAYRRTLLSRDRIVTKEDIKALCYEIYNNKITNVSVTKGYTTDLAINKGILQCINIELTKNNKNPTEPNEWDALNENLLLYLKNNAINVFPYVIKLN